MPGSGAVPWERARRAVLLGVLANSVLALVKITTGIVGRSQALVADGIESAMDVLSSAMIWGALKFAEKPPDHTHPYGHGKVESLAAVAGAVFLIGAGAAVAAHAISSLWQSHFVPGSEPTLPSPYTLLVLVVVILLKEILFRIISKESRNAGSTAMKADAWHHRSDALTSAAAFIGITVALVGGPRFAAADSWAALFSCVIIIANGLRMLRAAIGEVMDEQVAENVVAAILKSAGEAPGVSSVEKCRVRKSGLTLIADLHVRVPGDLSVREGHAIAHQVSERLQGGGFKLADVTVHIEPEPDQLPPDRNLPGGNGMG